MQQTGPDVQNQHILDKEKETDKRFYRYFSPKRGFLIPIWLEKLIGKQLAFSMNSGWAKYYQVDKGETVDADEDDF